MTPELQAMIEAVGKWKERATCLGPRGAAICDTYDAYMASLTTPPACLPPAPQGKRWVRVEYQNGWHDAQDGDRLVNPPDEGFYVFSGHGSEYGKGLAQALSSRNEYCRGLAQALRHGWRLEDDPDCDSLEKIEASLNRIADELGSCVLSNMIRQNAHSIRALIGEGKK